VDVTGYIYKNLVGIAYYVPRPYGVGIMEPHNTVAYCYHDVIPILSYNNCEQNTRLNQAQENMTWSRVLENT
jgi:hypothetical protein